MCVCKVGKGQEKRETGSEAGSVLIVASLMRGWNSKPWGHNLRWSQMLNRLSHPRAPRAFDLKWHMWDSFFLWLEHLRGHYGVINWPKFQHVLSQRIERSKEREKEAEEPAGGAVRTHPTHSYVCWLLWALFVEPQHNHNSNIKNQQSQGRLSDSAC